MYHYLERSFDDFKRETTDSSGVAGGEDATSYDITTNPPFSDCEPSDDYGPTPLFAPRPVDLQNIVTQRHCIHKGYAKGDGHFDVFTGKYTQYRCVTKDCPRHWRRYARLTYRKLKRQFSHFPYWHFVRLSCFSPYTEKVQRSLIRFHQKLKSSHRGSQSIGVYHTGRSGVHVHLIVGTHEAVNAEDIKQFWSKHFPSKKNHEFTPHAVHVKVARNPLQCLWYCLMGRQRKPRTIAPWRGLSRRFPYQVFLKPI